MRLKPCLYYGWLCWMAFKMFRSLH